MLDNEAPADYTDPFKQVTEQRRQRAAKQQATFQRGLIFSRLDHDYAKEALPVVPSDQEVVMPVHEAATDVVQFFFEKHIMFSSAERLRVEQETCG